jgi:hypothetical protein
LIDSSRIDAGVYIYARGVYNNGLRDEEQLSSFSSSSRADKKINYNNNFIIIKERSAPFFTASARGQSHKKFMRF